MSGLLGRDRVIDPKCYVLSGPGSGRYYFDSILRESERYIVEKRTIGGKKETLVAHFTSSYRGLSLGLRGSSRTPREGVVAAVDGNVSSVGDVEIGMSSASSISLNGSLTERIVIRKITSQ